MSLLSIAGATPSDDGFELKSARFDDGSLAYLSRTFTQAGNRKNWTFSCWFKLGAATAAGGEDYIFTAGSGNSGYTDFLRVYQSKLKFACVTSGGVLGYKTTTALLRDPAAWYHVVATYDSPNATAGDRMRLYLNGERVTAFSESGDVSQNFQSYFFNTAVQQFVGAYSYSQSNQTWDGYLAEVYFVDGSSLDPSYFGATNADTNQWQPTNPTTVKQAVTFGNNGFYLPFSNDALATSFPDNSLGSAFIPTEALSVDVLLVAGGGGGGGGYGNGAGGGGGAGGFRALASTAVTAQNYLVTVGTGGAGGVPFSAPAGLTYDGDKGGNSSFGATSATGGGGGAGFNRVGNTGGSAGGSTNGGAAVAGNEGGYSPVEGFGAALCTNSGNGGSGGGGASAEGATNTGSPAQTGGQGGAGADNAYRTGSNVTYAGGGSAGQGLSGTGSTAGGSGGGGAGGNGAASSASDGADGTDGLGGGGGGAGHTGSTGNGGTGGDGGNGIVVIRYQSATVKATGGTITTYGAGASQYQVHTFTSSVATPRHTITANGNTTNTRISNHKMRPDRAVIIGPKIGSSAIAFDGDEDFLSVPDSADWDFGTGDFTVDFWANGWGNAFGGGTWEDDAFLWAQVADTNNFAGVRIRTNGDVTLMTRVGGSYTLNLDFDTVTMPLDEWFHFALVRNTSGTNRFEIYINGKLQQTINNTTAWPDIAGAFTIGDDFYNADKEFTGFMDEFRVSKGVARWTANFTPETTEYASDAYTKLLIHSNTTMGSTTFTDSSGSPHTIAANGNIKHVAPKIGTGMGAYNGTTSQVETFTAPIDWAFGTQDFTFDLWAYADAWENNDCFFEAYASATDYWEFRIKTNGDLALSSYVGGSHVVDLDWDSANMPTGAWVHVELSRTGSTWRCFINGTETGDAQTSSGSLGTAGRQLKIGRSGRLNTFFKGYIDELRISKGIVRHTSNFTPSTIAYTADRDTILLLHLDGGGGIDPETNLPTLPGQGRYWWDASTNAIFYGADGIPTNKSIISFDGTGDYLITADSSDWDFGTENWTIEFWINFTGGLGSPQRVINFADNTSPPIGGMVETGADNKMAYYEYTLNNDWTKWCYDTNAYVLGTWYHYAIVREGSDFTMYRDGVEQESDGTSSASLASAHGPYIGTNRGITAYTTGYMDQIRISNTAIYTSAFTPPTTPFTADANTKLLIQSDFSEGGLGADHSGNYNYFTPTNLGVDDMMEDSPKNNFCTLNPLHWGIRNAADSVPLSEGNLKFTGSDTISTYGTWYATFQPSAGSYYFEMVPTAIGSAEKQSQYINVGGKAFKANGESSAGAYGTAWTAGDVIGVAVSTAGVWYSLNGTWQNSGDPVAETNSAGVPSYPFTILTGDGSATTNSSLSGVLNFGQDSSFAGQKTAQGNSDGSNKGDFYYTPPSGFLALCTDNLPAPSIALPGEYFNTKLYTGTGAELAVTGVGFQPDFTWIKTRVLAYNHRVFDVVRGATKEVYTNATNAEVTDAQALKSFDSDGFTLGTGSGSNPVSTMVSWNWKAGTSFDPATAGTVTTGSGSANSTAGFSIVKYTGEAGSITVGHGLSQAPEMIIAKNLDGTYFWAGYHKDIGNTKSISINDNGSSYVEKTWNDTTPSASVFTLGASTETSAHRFNYTGEDFIAYCFHSVEGYSKVGSYAGNANADGAFIYTGFRPAYVLAKSYDYAYDWPIIDNQRDPYNVISKGFNASTNSAELNNAANNVDFVSNGFKLRSNHTMFNGSHNYIYLAFAESPFKTSNAR